MVLIVCRFWYHHYFSFWESCNINKDFKGCHTCSRALVFIISIFMFWKSHLFAGVMDCCGCFGFTRRRPKGIRTAKQLNYRISQDFLLDEEIDDDDISYDGEATNPNHGDDAGLPSRAKKSEEILKFREQNGLICRQFPVKETNILVRSEVSENNSNSNCVFSNGGVTYV